MVRRVGRVGRRRRRLGGVVWRARAGGRRRRIFRGAGGGRRAGRAGGRRAERDQPQQRHAPPPEHGGQRAGSAPDAARGPLATEIRAPLTRAPASSLRVPAGIRAASGRLARRRGCARAATRRLGRRSRERTTAPEHYFGSDAPRRCRRPPAARCQFYAKLRAGGDAICTTPRPPAAALPVRCSITFCRDLSFSLRGFFCEVGGVRRSGGPATPRGRRRSTRAPAVYSK